MLVNGKYKVQILNVGLKLMTDVASKRVILLTICSMHGVVSKTVIVLQGVTNFVLAIVHLQCFTWNGVRVMGIHMQ